MSEADAHTDPAFGEAIPTTEVKVDKATRDYTKAHKALVEAKFAASQTDDVKTRATTEAAKLELAQKEVELLDTLKAELDGKRIVFIGKAEQAYVSDGKGGYEWSDNPSDTAREYRFATGVINEPGLKPRSSKQADPDARSDVRFVIILGEDTPGPELAIYTGPDFLESWEILDRR